MKRSLALIIVLALGISGLTGFAAAPAMADDTPAAKAKEKSGPGVRMTEEQRAQVRALVDRYNELRQAAKEAGDKQRAHELRDEFFAEVRKVLDAEQYAVWKARREAKRQQNKEKDGGDAAAS